MPPLNATDAHELDYSAPALRVIDEAPSRPESRHMVVRACRPRQWIKNVLVVIAPAAAGALTRPAVAGAVFVALIAFCLLSSATYLVNDVRDAERDRRHPRKRFRPVAAGELSPARALRIAAIMAALGLVAVGYLALTTSYSFWWRHVVVADIVAIAGGFVLRAVAGGVAAGVPLSRSFLGVTSACALFLVAGKRYAELTGARERSLTRVTLGKYSRRLLRWLMLAAAALACLAYLRWAFTRPQFGPWVELSSLPFVMWLGRYLIMLAAGYGEAPEELILRDPGLLALGAAWAALFVAGIYVAP
jgi:decaprenyl-phosphate phosphoribosyltransferase